MKTLTCLMKVFMEFAQGEFFLALFKKHPPLQPHLWGLAPNIIIFLLPLCSFQQFQAILFLQWHNWSKTLSVKSLFCCSQQQNSHWLQWDQDFYSIFFSQSFRSSSFKKFPFSVSMLIHFRILILLLSSSHILDANKASCYKYHYVYQETS